MIVQPWHRSDTLWGARRLTAISRAEEEWSSVMEPACVHGMPDDGVHIRVPFGGKQ